MVSPLHQKTLNTLLEPQYPTRSLQHQKYVDPVYKTITNYTQQSQQQYQTQYLRDESTKTLESYIHTSHKQIIDTLYDVSKYRLTRKRKARAEEVCDIEIDFEIDEENHTFSPEARITIPEDTRSPRIIFDENLLRAAVNTVGVSEETCFAYNEIKNLEETSPLLNLNYISILGVDIKITPENQAQFVEVNGLHMGMKGFKQLGIKHTMNLSWPKKLLAKYDLVTEASLPTVPEAVRKHVANYGEYHVAALGAGVIAQGQNPRRLTDFQKMLPVASMYFEDEYKPALYVANESLYHAFSIGMDLGRFNNVLADKYYTDQLFSELRKYKPEAIPFTKKGKKAFLELCQEDRVVLKGRTGARGNGVKILKKERLAKLKPTGNSRIMEPFITSKPIYSDQTGQHHDGCMRYVAILEQSLGGYPEVHHFGGYWRLSPTPLTNTSGVFGYGGSKTAKANLSAGAIAQTATAKELRIAKKAVEATMPQIHQRMHDEHRAWVQEEIKRLKRERK